MAGPHKCEFYVHVSKCKSHFDDPVTVPISNNLKFSNFKVLFKCASENPLSFENDFQTSK